jgi:hypothetical protein
MAARTNKKRLWRRDRPVQNPYRDSLRQEIGYRLDARTTGCLLTSIAVGLVVLAGITFVIYWLTHGV